MSTPPRDAGIPMLTEVIDDAGMEAAGPLQEPADSAATAEAAAEPAEIAAQPFQAEQAAPPPQSGAVPSPVMPAVTPAQPAQSQPIQPQPQLTPAYPIPLKPAASAAPAAPSDPAFTPTPAVQRPSPAAGPEPAAVALPPSMSDEEWQRMERRVRERILGQLLSRTDAMLEERIRIGLTGVVEQAVEELAAGLRVSLHKTLEDVVSRAVAQEISRLQSSKK